MSDLRTGVDVPWVLKGHAMRWDRARQTFRCQCGLTYVRSEHPSWAQHREHKRALSDLIGPA